MSGRPEHNQDLFSLEGKVAMVTGAGRGLGRAIARRLARAGADLALVARSEGELKDAARELKALGVRAAAFPCDLSQVAQLAPLVETVAAELGAIDILVNNAGTNIPQPALEVSEEAWDEILGLNLKSAFFLAQAVGREMIRRGGGGRIVNISSQTGSVALLKRAAYCASKAGLNLVTRVLALEWGKYEILVNAVAPTFIETEMTREFLADRDFRRYALSKNLLGRFGVPDDVAAAVLYLASPAANLVTGHVLLVDAGWTAH